MAGREAAVAAVVEPAVAMTAAKVAVRVEEVTAVAERAVAERAAATVGRVALKGVARRGMRRTPWETQLQLDDARRQRACSSPAAASQCVRRTCTHHWHLLRSCRTARSKEARMAVATRVAWVDLAVEGLEVDEAGKPCTQCTQAGAPEQP